jgi:hypothetical protein
MKEKTDEQQAAFDDAIDRNDQDVFMDIVSRDIKRETTEEEIRFLRSDSVIDRFWNGLTTMRREVETALSVRSADLLEDRSRLGYNESKQRAVEYAQWKRKAVGFKKAVEARMAEIKSIRSEHHKKNPFRLWVYCVRKNLNENLLNELGMEGWELVSVENNYFYLKKKEMMSKDLKKFLKQLDSQALCAMAFPKMFKPYIEYAKNYDLATIRYNEVYITLCGVLGESPESFKDIVEQWKNKRMQGYNGNILDFMHYKEDKMSERINARI